MRRWSGGRGGDRGATLVEFALIAPLLFLILGAMLNIGLAVLGGSVASNGAREGARVGILSFDQADNTASANYAAIQAAVDSKLVKLITPDTSSGHYVQVKCLSGDNPSVQIACTTAAVRVDRDLLEVTVKWKSISPINGPFTASTYSNKARMVITGSGNAGSGSGGTGGTCTTPAGAMSWSPATAAVNEGNTGTVTDVVLTATRAGNTTCTSTVGFSTFDGSATVADNDYEPTSGLLTFLPGESSTQVTLSGIVIGDATFEAPPQTFTVVMTSGTAVNGSIGTSTATVTITNDDVSGGAPQLVALKMFDTDSDGKVDQVTAQFDATLAPYTAGNAPWTLANVPSGGTLKSVTVSGTTATLLLNEGPGAENTAAGSFTIALAQNNNGIRDSLGNKSSFPATPVQDWASPVLLSVADTDGAADGKAEQNDTLTLTFSEAIAASTLPTTTNVQETAGSTPMLSIPGVIVATALNPKNNGDYTNACTLSFPNSTVTSNSVNKTVTVALAAPTAGCNALAGESSNSGMSFSPDPGLTDGIAVGRNAAGPTAPIFNTGNKWHLF